MVEHSNEGEMREHKYENGSICHNQPICINEVHTDSVLDTLNLTKNYSG
jgi:hypothetical protein